jgi:hypothetical protein
MMEVSLSNWHVPLSCECAGVEGCEEIGGGLLLMATSAKGALWAKDSARLQMMRRQTKKQPFVKEVQKVLNSETKS